ncbi:glutathione S-transferase II [Neohortaea acidophila]|uniref:Glutathione S-transferase II n=1 Tax=Neohortaea acidophila TaxID=245834 RepID=A0A6A6PW35_9PEZI|nr:glutathione S-transferase II [Neohortaea acidophila]KAF2484252.1 glutathione S-transferase II [Neohortaea acidophila]
MASESDIHLYTTQTPNGIKISITLEELGLPYKVTKISFQENTQKEPWFLEINPNGRIPALTDKFTDGKPIRVFESGSIMQYLVDRYDGEHRISYPKGSREDVEVTSWVFFLNAGVGPMQGQANHFGRYCPEKIEYGINRYRNETRRLYGVLDKHLSDAGTEYLVGNKCTIADIAHWGWISAAGWAGVEIEEFPTLKKWEDRMWARPATKKGANVPEPYRMKELLADKAAMEKHAAQGQAWVQGGMKDDAEKLKARSAQK